ncbi:competence protein ComA [Mannheimia granulomatis]|uniref:competence protein ComA n=1 Tax=Mannheimia granulomatis TaxID=85402 RepID=UPI00159DAF24|nr:competence protein ComA [Mannheimia granulomatis]QLB14289.1 competence protein ComA [Mannheimia granulomatis]
MKLLQKVSKACLQPYVLGLSEDEHYYCLVKKETEKFTVFWQKKPFDLACFIQMNTNEKLNQHREKPNLIRPISHSYIWRKTVFLPKTLNAIQLHQHIIQILKNEQPLSIETLNFDYQQFSLSNNNLNKIVIYALRKSYADNLTQIPCVLDCELHCYIRAISYFKNLTDKTEFPPFSFQQKTVQFTEANIRFLPIAPENCIKIEDIEISESEINSIQHKHLYLLAVGASLWNGKVLI